MLVYWSSVNSFGSELYLFESQSVIEQKINCSVHVLSFLGHTSRQVQYFLVPVIDDELVWQLKVEMESSPHRKAVQLKPSTRSVMLCNQRVSIFKVKISFSFPRPVWTPPSGCRFEYDGIKHATESGKCFYLFLP